MEEPEVDSKKLEKMPALSISLPTLHNCLQEMSQAVRLGETGAMTQIRKDVQGGCILADQLWNLKDLQKRQFERNFILRGHVDASPDDEEAGEEDNTAAASTRAKKGSGPVRVGAHMSRFFC